MTTEEWPVVEEWRAIEGYDGWYEVSDRGRVRSWHKPGSRSGERAVRPRVLKPGTLGYGYLHACLRRDGGQISRTIHRLVAYTFIGPRPAGLQICHNDGNPANNAVNNLRYDTVSANQLDKILHGTMPRGARHHATTLTEGDVIEIRQRSKRGEKSPSIAETYGITSSSVRMITLRRSWKHVA